MAFKFKNSKGNEYVLHARVTKLRNGKDQTLYYFSKEEKAGAIDAVPEGYQVTETANGLPVLQRSGGKKNTSNKK